MPEGASVNLKINGKDIQVPQGTVVIEAAKQAGFDVPFFCYHPRLTMEQGANCRMCLVEVAMPRKNPDGTTVLAKMPKPQTACSLPVSEGMEIVTENEALAKDRKGIVEFLLINHPLDCPICDRGGECPLQNNAIHYGAGTSRYTEEKRHFPKAYPLSDHVVFDRERCIHCARCTRFTQDISGDAQLDFLFRGANMEVGTHGNTEFKSKFSGNVIELCPVGALLSKEYRFKARPWDLLTEKSICTECSNGCNIKIDYRVGKLQRVNARVNEQVNEEWTCDRGKFGMGYVSSDNRLKTPMLRRDGDLVPVSWSEAMSVLVDRLKAAGSSVGAIAGPRVPNEDLYALRRLMQDVLNSQHLDHRLGPVFDPLPNGVSSVAPLVDLEQAKTILAFGSNLVDEQPILFLRTRKASRFKGVSVVEALPATDAEDDTPNHVSEFASVSLRYKPGTENELIKGILAVILEEGLHGAGEASKSASGASVSGSCAATGVTEDALRRAARLIATDGLVILAGDLINRQPNRNEALSGLVSLARTVGSPSSVHVPATSANTAGAELLGVTPGPGGKNTTEMLRHAAGGSLGLLWLVQSNILDDYCDRAVAEAALDGKCFVVANALTLDATAQRADLVLPVQSIVERDGSLTNVEGRVQRFYRAFEVDPAIQSDWSIFVEASNLLGKPLRWFGWKDILREILASVPSFASVTAIDLDSEGALLNCLQSATTAVSA